MINYLCSDAWSEKIVQVRILESRKPCPLMAVARDETLQGFCLITLMDSVKGLRGSTRSGAWQILASMALIDSH